MTLLATIHWATTHCLINLLICITPGDAAGEELLNAIYRWQRLLEKGEA